jgi:XTP/dITP diphosphohydrolase
MKNLLLATNNAGKIHEFSTLLVELNFNLLTPQQLGLNIEIDENGESYADNAAIKSHAYHTETGYLTLGDDSGLEVECLDGKPGIHSARFSPLEGADDSDRRLYLISRLQGHPHPWKARFVCVLAITGTNHKTTFFEGTCSGEIIVQEAGDHGFGYDPIFYIPTLKRTMAQLSPEEKNQVSHRAKAVHSGFEFLRSLQ